MNANRLKPILVSCLVTGLVSSVAFGDMIFSQQYDSNANWTDNDGRRYTTFGTSVSNFSGDLLDADGNSTGTPVSDVASGSFGATNNNDGGTNPGPGFAYIPTGVAWEPDTIYSIDFLVANRNDGTFTNNIVEYGLWAGLPDGDTGPGDYNSGTAETFDAQTRPSLGTEGAVRISAGRIGNGNAMFVSDLSGTSTPDEVFLFSTGSDVSQLGDMVLFLRTDTGRIHWDNVSVTAIPEPGTYALLAGLVALVGAGMVRLRRNRRT